MKRLFLIAACLFLSGLAPHAFSAEGEPILGQQYVVIDPPLASNAPKGKIEVIEFFSYGCPHCKHFFPFISSWSAKLGKDVSFRKVPVSFNRPAWARLASIYYSLELTGDLAKLDGAVFTALHDENANFNDDEKIIDWVSKKGGDSKKFAEALNSFGMQSRVRRGQQEAEAAKISGVPAIVVGGKYLLLNEGSPGGPEDLLRVADALIDKVRREGGK